MHISPPGQAASRARLQELPSQARARLQAGPGRKSRPGPAAWLPRRPSQAAKPSQAAALRLQPGFFAAFCSQAAKILQPGCFLQPGCTTRVVGVVYSDGVFDGSPVWWEYDSREKFIRELHSEREPKPTKQRSFEPVKGTVKTKHFMPPGFKADAGSGKIELPDEVKATLRRKFKSADL